MLSPDRHTGAGSPGKVATWTLNGRFLSQPLTGVQRYAREIIRALGDLARDNHPAARGVELTLALPPAQAAPEWLDSHMASRHVGRGGGHVWEQSALRSEPALLSLCNTGPLLVPRQIVCIHDANVWLIPESYTRAFRLVYRALLPALGRRARRVVTVSQFSAGQLARFGIASADRISVLPNGHEHVFRWDATRAASVTPARWGGRPYVLLLGSRARHKNIGLVTRLAPRLAERGLDIVVAGGGSGIFEAEGSDGPAPNVHFLGHVSDDDLAFLFQGATVFAFPSLVEGFGLPVLEAMALGCPVLSSNAASMPEIGGEAIILADPTNGEEWLARITDLAGSENLRAELASRGRTRAGLFSWRNSALGYLDLMRSEALERRVA